jgi:hypothetical protein
MCRTRTRPRQGARPSDLHHPSIPRHQRCISLHTQWNSLDRSHAGCGPRPCPTEAVYLGGQKCPSLEFCPRPNPPPVANHPPVLFRRYVHKVDYALPVGCVKLDAQSNIAQPASHSATYLYNVIITAG